MARSLLGAARARLRPQTQSGPGAKEYGCKHKMNHMPAPLEPDRNAVFDKM